MRRLFPLLFSALLMAGCRSKPSVDPQPPVIWTPDDVYRAPGADAPRGLLDLRGVIHSHSPYSHDACDNAPRDPETDAIDEVCFDDLRRGICQVRHDFLMLTDHAESFARTPYPDVLLYRADRGDTLVEREGHPVANWVTCGEGERTLVLAGTETGTMPVGLEEHVAPDEAERRRIYGSTDPADMEILKAHGGVVLANHTEGWEDSELIDKPFDGFEMYNIHANVFLNMDKALELLVTLKDHPERLPHPELILLVLISEDPVYLGRWSRVLASGVHRVTTMATDVHRNTFRDLLQDGERIDSFRRIMRMFSNHLLVRPMADGSWDDRSLKEALRAERLYGAFETLGFPVGFDYHAEAAGSTYEMGESVSLTAQPRLVVHQPKVEHLDPSVRAPEIETRIYRATPEGFEQVASSHDATLSFDPSVPGAYRAEIRMKPWHLVGYLGDYDYLVEDQDFVWIYSNAIYVE